MAEAGSILARRGEGAKVIGHTSRGGGGVINPEILGGQLPPRFKGGITPKIIGAGVINSNTPLRYALGTEILIKKTLCVNSCFQGFFVIFSGNFQTF